MKSGGCASLIASNTASEIVSFSASVRTRLGAVTDSGVGSIGKSRFDSHPASQRTEIRTNAIFRILAFLFAVRGRATAKPSTAIGRRRKHHFAVWNLG